MTKEEMREQIKFIKDELSQNREVFCKPRLEKIKEIENKLYLKIIEDKEYITDLSEYNGKEISFIALSSKGEEVSLPTDEIVEVSDGRLYLSSYEGGIVEWNEDEKKYIEYAYGGRDPLDIVGFIDISIKDNKWQS